MALGLGEQRGLWLGQGWAAQVQEGWCVLSAAVGADQAPRTQWVGPGDWLGAEWLDRAPVPAVVAALAPVVMQVWPVGPSRANAPLLMQCLDRQQQRASEWLALRSGPADQRLRVLLDLLSPQGTHRWPSSAELPSLKDIAQLVDLAPETACRALSRVRAGATGSPLPRPATARSPGTPWWAVLAAALAVAPPASAADTTPAAQLQRWSAETGTPGQAAQGRVFFSRTHGREWSCASCHQAPPTTPGQHANTGKPIAPMAPAFNDKAFTDTAKVDKWFRRNCKDVLGRECSATEKADVLAYLLSLTR